jgi:anthranilate synthase component 2
MILLIDNYDSFSFNVYQLIGSVNPDIKVVRNDAVKLSDIVVMRPSHIVISPGPGKPADAGICEEAIAAFAGKIPILGVCLGHQAICETFGATVSYAKHVMHGKASPVTLDKSCPIFAGLPETIGAARYHSLAAVESTVKPPLIITAKSEDNEIMGVRRRDFDVYGLQFHPESILTPEGKKIMENFLSITQKTDTPRQRAGKSV